mgnify:FL=1
MLYKMICEQGTKGRLANASFDVAEYDNLVFHVHANLCYIIHLQRYKIIGYNKGRTVNNYIFMILYIYIII